MTDQQANDELDTFQILDPHPWQIVLMPNPVYWKSLLVGITAPVLNLPLMVWTLLLRPLLLGTWTIFFFFLSCWVMGPLGRVTGLPLPQWLGPITVTADAE